MGEVALTPEQLAAEEAADQEAYELDRAAVERFVESGEDAKARKVAARWDGLPEIAERLIAARADPLFISAPTQSEEAQPAKVEHEFRFPKWKFTEEKEGAGESEAQAKAAAQEVVKVEAKVESAPKAVPKQKAKPQPAWPEAPLPPEGATALEALTYPRGLLGHATQYIYDTAALPDRLLALAAALCALAKGLDRKVLGPTENSVVMFILLLAWSGVGKQHALNCVRVLLRAMGVEQSYIGTGIASLQAVEEVLEGTKDMEAQPSALFVIDEYASFLLRISSKGMTGNVAEIPSILQTLWGWHPKAEFFGNKKVGKQMHPVYGPALSIFGAAIPKNFFAALTKKEVASGFVNRHVLFNAGRGAAKRIRPKYHWQQCEKWLIDALKEVAGDPAPIDNRPRSLGKTALWDFRKIGWGPGAEELWLKFEEETRALDEEKMMPWVRAPEVALRLATVVAFYRRSPVVEVEDLEWGIPLARLSCAEIERGLSKHQLEELAQADVCDLIRGLFRNSLGNRKHPGVLTHGYIRRTCERKVKDLGQVDKAIAQLLLTEEIVAYDDSGPGRPAQKWKWQSRE
jgi:hypothetical protein